MIPPFGDESFEDANITLRNFLDAEFGKGDQGLDIKPFDEMVLLLKQRFAHSACRIAKTDDDTASIVH